MRDAFVWLSVQTREVQARVNSLFALDYEFSTIDNHSGSYCSSYPLEIVILERSKGASQRKPCNPDDPDTCDPSPEASPECYHGSAVNDSTRLEPYFAQTQFARCHGRFVVPVLLLGDKPNMPPLITLLRTNSFH